MTQLTGTKARVCPGILRLYYVLHVTVPQTQQDDTLEVCLLGRILLDEAAKIKLPSRHAPLVEKKWV